MTSSQESDRIAEKPGQPSGDHLRIETRDDGQGSKVYFCRDPAGRLWSFGPNHARPRLLRRNQANPFDSNYPARNFVIAALMVSFLGGWAMVAHHYPGTISQAVGQLQNRLPGNNPVHSQEWQSESSSGGTTSSALAHQIRPNSRNANSGQARADALNQRINRLESELRQTLKDLEAAKLRTQDYQQRQQKALDSSERAQQAVRRMQKELELERVRNTTNRQFISDLLKTLETVRHQSE